MEFVFGEYNFEMNLKDNLLPFKQKVKCQCMCVCETVCIIQRLFKTIYTDIVYTQYA